MTEFGALREDKGRRNGYAADWCEQASSTKFNLVRVDENMCDAYSTHDTPVIDAGMPVETKAALTWLEHNGGTSGPRMRGRFSIGPTHEQLVEEEGYYALVVYDVATRPDGQDCIVVLRCALIDARTVDALVPAYDEVKSEYRKLSWGNIFDSAPPEQPIRPTSASVEI